MKRIHTLPLLALLALTLVPNLKSQSASAQQLYVVTYIDVFPNFVPDTNKALDQMAADSRKDTGNVRFEVLRDTVRTNHIAIVEVWQDQKAYEAHLMREHSKQFREKIQPFLGSPFDERLYHLMP